MALRYLILRHVPCRPDNVLAVQYIIAQYSLVTFRTSHPHELQLYTRPQQIPSQPSLRAQHQQC